MSANQRQFSRCPLPEENSSAELIVNGRSISCKLVEMSIGGFGVVAPQSARVNVNDGAHFKTRGLDYIVCVSYLKPSNDGVFIGLKQIEELVPDNTALPNAAPWLTNVVWAAAISSVAAAVYCVSGIQQMLPK